MTDGPPPAQEKSEAVSGQMPDRHRKRARMRKSRRVFQKSVDDSKPSRPGGPIQTDRWKQGGEQGVLYFPMK